MNSINLVETDRSTANKFLKIAVSMFFACGAVVFFLHNEKHLSDFIFLVPIVAFLINFALFLFYRRRNHVHKLVIEKGVYVCERNGEKTSISIASINKICVTKIWGSEESDFVVYICTDVSRVRVPDFESITSSAIVKTLLALNPSIDAEEFKKVFVL